MRENKLKVPLKNKFIILYLCFVLIPTMVFACYLYMMTFSNLKTNLYLGSKTGFEQTTQLVTYFTQNVNYSINAFLDDDELHDIIERDNTAISLQKQITDMMYVRSLISSYRGKSEINDVILYVKNEALYIGDDSSVKTLASIEDTDWYDYAKLKFPDKALIPASYFPAEDSVALVKFVRSSTNYSVAVGLIRFDIKLTQLVELLGEFNTDTDAYLYLVNTDNDLICSNHDTGTFIPIEQLSGFADGEAHKLSIVNDQYVTYVSKIDNTDWFLAEVIPYSRVINQLMSKSVIYLIIFFIIITLGFAFLYLFIKLFLNRIGFIKGHMSDIQNTLPPLVEEGKSGDEIDELIHSYNYMLTRMDDLLKEQYTLGNQIRDAEMKTLYEQINPHFLYNTLSMINWFAEDGETENITNVITALSNFYRLCLNKGNAYITLRDEFQIIDDFIYIQKMRFGTDISMQYHVEDSLLDFVLPKLTLQPLVENALVHGILKKRSKDGIIKLYVSHDDMCYKIVIEDDGVGIEPDILSKLNKGTLNSNTKHYGIFNVVKRLSLYYGNTCSIYYESTIDMGTSAELTIPYQASSTVFLK